jgi:hypothetical protein
MTEEKPHNDTKNEQSQPERPISPGDADQSTTALPLPSVVTSAGVAATAKTDELKRECPKEISVRLLEEKKLTTFERLSIVLSAVTLFTLFITFLVFYGQLQESKRQTELFRKQAEQAAIDAHKAQDQTQQQMDFSKDSFRRDQQPYVWVAGTPTSENYQNPLTKEFQVIVSAHYRNFGKSPAIALQRYSLVEVGPNALSRIHSGKLGEARTITQPTEDQNFSSVTPPMKSLPEMDRDDEVVLFTRFQYLDLLGHRYETDFCMAHLQTGAWQYCETHNEIKDCEKVACEP